MDYPRLGAVVAVNERLSFDGGLTAVVRELLLDEIKLEFTSAGQIQSRSAVRLEGKRYELMDLMRPSDKQALREVAAKHRFDYISLACVTSSKDVQQAKIALKELNPKIGVLVKIDTIEGLHQYENLLKIADGVIIMRQDLSNDMSPEKL